MYRNITAPHAFTTVDTLGSRLMIWVLDVARFVMHLMSPTDSPDGVLVSVDVIWALHRPRTERMDGKREGIVLQMLDSSEF